MSLYEVTGNRLNPIACKVDFDKETIISDAKRIAPLPKPCVFINATIPLPPKSKYIIRVFEPKGNLEHYERLTINTEERAIVRTYTIKIPRARGNELMLEIRTYPNSKRVKILKISANSTKFCENRKKHISELSEDKRKALLIAESIALSKDKLEKLTLSKQKPKKLRRIKIGNIPITIYIVPVIKLWGKEQTTPAVSNVYDNSIYISAARINCYSIPSVVWAILHEIGHIYGNRKMGFSKGNELAADLFAISIMLKAGYSRYMIYKALVETFSYAYTTQNKKRLKLAKKLLEKTVDR